METKNLIEHLRDENHKFKKVVSNYEMLFNLLEAELKELRGKESSHRFSGRIVKMEL